MSGRVYLLGVGIVLIGAGFMTTNWLLTPPPGVTMANLPRIRPGMGLAEVESLLGGPGIHIPWVLNEEGPLFWKGPEGTIHVQFYRPFINPFSSMTVHPTARPYLVRPDGQTVYPSPIRPLRAWFGW